MVRTYFVYRKSEFTFPGTVHEMSRWDRDYHVSVITENIETNREKEFTKKPRRTHGTRETPFDIESVMMYPSTAWGKIIGQKRMKTIEPLTPGEMIR